jgi:mannose-6-phosphate isomerase-like protein (cupin superfamily)
MLRAIIQTSHKVGFMFIKNLQHCEEFVAGDNTILRELLHPDKAALQLRYSLAHAVVPPGKTSFRHALKTSEVYYILEGTGVMYIDDEAADTGPGDVIYIRPHARQCIHNSGDDDLRFLCIVDPAWRAEDEEVL